MPRQTPVFGAREKAAAGLVVAAVLFNVLLAFVNAHVVQLGRPHVIAAEMLIVAGSLVLCFRCWSPLMLPWLGLMWLLIVLFLGLSFIRGFVDPKFIRDVLLLPTFVMLGMTYARGSVVRLFFVLQAIVVAVMVYEALSPGGFGNLFNISKYYIDTRGFQQSNFWGENSELFVSSSRPGDRFLLGSLDIHRLSSVFLEPVSLGNWAVIVAILTASLWPSLPLSMRAFLLISNFAVLVGCDGRLATVACVIILAVMPIVPKLPARLPLLYLPGVVILAMIATSLLGLRAGSDDFSGRIASSMHLLGTFSIGALFGTDLALLDRVADSGISYFILTQSILGVAAIWLAICLLQPTTTRRTIVLTHSTCIYLSLVLMISYSLFSIKTSAPLWFLYGYVRARAESDLADAVAQRQRQAAEDAAPSQHLTGGDFRDKPHREAAPRAMS